MQTYTVLKGDTIYGISKQFGVSVSSIKRANNLSSDSISIGQKLIIPTSETSEIYIVKRGDTLYSIAKKYNTTPDIIVDVNNLNSINIFPGQELRIPINSNNTNVNKYINYTVVKGDSLYSIARKYNVTVDEIKSLNNLKSNLLSIGQVLKIPTSSIIDTEVTPTPPSSNTNIYIVKKGDTLYSIANKFGTTVSNIKELNNLTSNNLSIGQRLIIKSNNISGIEGETECYGTGYTEPVYLIHTVKKGDNLYAIARKYDTTISKIVELNNLPNTNLSIGQELKIKEV